MTELADLFKQQQFGTVGDKEVLSGSLVRQNGKDYAKIDNSTKLWGPIKGAENLAHGDAILVGLDQLSVPYVIWPNGSGSGGGGEGGVSFSQVIGDGVAKAFVVNHNIGTRDVQVFVRKSVAPYDEVICEVEHTDASKVTIRTINAPAPGEFTVVCSGPGAASGGGGGGDLNYVHNQGSPSATWVATHNLGKYVSVEVVDTGDTVVIPTVHYDSLNQVTLLFGSPTSGKAFMN